MKKALVISYNIVRENEMEYPLSIASIINHARSDIEYGSSFTIDEKHFNLFSYKNELGNFENYLDPIDLNKYDIIAVSCFVWNEYLTNPLLNFIRANGYKNKIVLGGSQITYADKPQLKSLYPQCDIFITGYGEASFLEILKCKGEYKDIYNIQVDFSTIKSPYLNGVLPLLDGQNMIRWETKRGCPYKCSFCAHRNLESGRVYDLQLEKSIQELGLFKEKSVKRVNILDPVFNMREAYLQIVKEIDNQFFHDTVFTYQSKIELLAKKDGQTFLDLVEKTNGHLEFGLQTIVPEEYQVIDRKNDINIIREQMEILRVRGTSYEVSLIYGLPNQTVSSFKQSIEFVKEMGCQKITAWPLMLLRGTPLFSEREKWNLNQEIIGEYDIPVVTSGNTFGKDQWLEMAEIANKLHANSRI